MRARVARVVPLILSLTLAACSPVRATQAPPTASAVATSTLPPSPTPYLFTVISGLNLFPSEGGWTAIGLVTNRSNVTAGEVWVRVTLDGPTGEQIGQLEITPAIAHLAPGETVPFSATFADVAAPSEAHAEVTRYAPAEFEMPEVVVTDLDTRRTIDGRLAVLGTAVNRSSEPIELSQIVVLAADEAGASLALGASSAHRARLERGAEGPFLAVLPLSAEDARLTPYVDATSAPSETSSRLTFLSPPALVEDEQGDLFVLGVIRNGESRPRWVSITVRVDQGAEVASVGRVDLPVPLGPGESRPFAITELPGIGSDMSADALQVEAWVDPFHPPEAGLGAVPLDVQVTSYEAIGGMLFLQGIVENGTGSTVTSASILAAVRSVEGAPLAAGWRIVAATLEPGASASFVLELALPRGIDLVTSEYDVVASGLAPVE